MENKNKRLLIVEDSLVMNPLSVANEIPELKQSLEKVVKDYETEHSSELEKYGIKPNDISKTVPEFIKLILSGEETNFQYSDEIKESSYLLKRHFENNPNPSILDCMLMPVILPLRRVEQILPKSFYKKYSNDSISDEERSEARPHRLPRGRTTRGTTGGD